MAGLEKRSPPLPATAAAIAALAGYALASLDPLLASLTVAALLVSQLVDFRLRHGALAVWSLRVALNAILITVAVAQRGRRFNIFDYYLYFVTQFCMAELALQYWQWPMLGGPGGAVVVLLSGLIYVTASKFYGETAIHYTAPVYFFFMAMTFHAMRTRAGGDPGQPRHWRWPRLAALALALIMGFGIVLLIRQHKSWLNAHVMNAAIFQPTPQAVGVTQNPVLGARTDVEQSPRRLLRVDGGGCPTYLRMLAFEQYHNGGWGPPVDRRQFEPVPAPELKPQAEGRKLWVTRLVSDFSHLAVPLHAMGLSGRRRQLEWSRDSAAPLRTWVWIEAPYTYELIVADQPAHQGPLCLAPARDYRLLCLDVPPEIDEQVRELAQRIAGEIRDPAGRVAAVQDYLLKTHAYSLTIDPGVGDPVSNFLLQKKPAHCEYFASAAVILLRCLDIPARYASGFYAHERSGSVTLVRERDAHAWAECWIDGFGWINVDGTPPDGHPDRALASLSFWARVMEYAEDAIDDLRDWLSDPTGEGLAVLICVVLGGVCITWIWKRLRITAQRAPPRSGYATPNPALLPVAESFDALLVRAGVPCPAHRTWQEHLTALAAQAGGALGRFDLKKAHGFAQFYASVRFGRPDDAESLARLREELKKLQA